MAFKSVVVLLSALACVNALATPHGISHHHRAIAARVAAPAPNPDLPLAHSPAKRRRSLSKRCKPRSAPVASSTSIFSSAAPSSSAALVNVGSDPSTIVAESPSPSSAPEPSPTTEAAPTTTQEPTTTERPAHTRSSTQEPAPTTSSTEAPAPTTSSSEEPAPTTSTEQAQTTSSSSSSSGSSNSGLSFLTGTQTGQATFYATGLGACGITNSDTDYIAAVSHLMFDVFPGWDGVNPNNNPICGKKITATYQGKSVTITVTDRCTGCALTDLDFSPSAFDQLASESLGRLSGMTWVWS